jgi:hypothetical protein
MLTVNLQARLFFPSCVFTPSSIRFFLIPSHLSGFLCAINIGAFIRESLVVRMSRHFICGRFDTMSSCPCLKNCCDKSQVRGWT